MGALISHFYINMGIPSLIEYFFLHFMHIKCFLSLEYFKLALSLGQAKILNRSSDIISLRLVVYFKNFIIPKDIFFIDDKNLKTKALYTCSSFSL